MPIIIQVQFDQGYDTYLRGLNSVPGTLKNMKDIFNVFGAYLEGRSEFWPGSPILKIWKTEGAAIGASWTNTSKYEAWKEKNYQSKRKFDTPIDRKNEQILTGQTLAGLLNSESEGAIREYKPTSMIFGIKNNYSYKWQGERNILDFYPEMEKGFDQVLSAYLRKKFPELRMVVQ